MPRVVFFLLIIKKTRRELELILACQNADERADGSHCITINRTAGDHHEEVHS